MRLIGPLTRLVIVTLGLFTAPVNAQEAITPAYIKADRSVAARTFNSAIINHIFSDELTKYRREFVSRSLQGNPVIGCPDSSPFTLTHIMPLQSDMTGFAWMERFEIDCNPKTLRNWVLVFKKDGTRLTQEILPGNTITDPKLQRDAFPNVTVVATTKGCQETPKLVETRFVEMISKSPVPWKELWLFRACGRTVEVDVQFGANPYLGGTSWSATVR